jgi:hypothetical protein
LVLDLIVLARKKVNFFGLLIFGVFLGSIARSPYDLFPGHGGEKLKGLPVLPRRQFCFLVGLAQPGRYILIDIAIISLPRRIIREFPVGYFDCLCAGSFGHFLVVNAFVKKRHLKPSFKLSFGWPELANQLGDGHVGGTRGGRRLNRGRGRIRL